MHCGVYHCAFRDEAGICTPGTIMADDNNWRQFKNKMKEKRTANTRRDNNKKENGGSAVPGDTITVQRLSAEVSGKLQKYSRIGDREFVAYDYDQCTIENIQLACMKHFGMSIDGPLCCDVVAGEQGPSCSSVKQLPDYKVIHVRFIERNDELNSAKCEPEAKSRKLQSAPVPRETSNCPVVQTAAATSKFIPKSLSLVEMLKLGKVIQQTSTSVEIYTFDFQGMSWSSAPQIVDFIIDKEPFGKGGFRKAFKATSRDKNFSHKTWVVKRYLPKSLEDIKATGQTPEQHTKKVVQMHYLARNFAAKLKSELEAKDNLGETFSYNKIMLGKITEEQEYVPVEEYVEGNFGKYVNNNGEICGNSGCLTEKAECLTHFSFERSNKEIIVVDIQGCGPLLFDPQIASREIIANAEYLFCTGNLSDNAMKTFTEKHKCNWYCQLLDLPVLQ